MLPQFIKEVNMNQNYELKYTPAAPSAIIDVFDKEKALGETSASVALAETS
jgi:hypothetical protein